MQQQSTACYQEAFQKVQLILGKLGPEGMSSDESGCEDEGCNRVVRKDWRSPSVISLLKWLDSHIRTFGRSTACGNQKPGPRPTRRIRRPAPESSNTTRKPTKHLPRNLFNEVWYSNLDAYDINALEVSEGMPIPIEVLSWPQNANLLVDKDDFDEY
ncbi:hypothetical protein K435DRAFT_876186 [Dendrothele bispora CBS 962.96]|uniref:Uncharacterized protein n=1 Tax=Dendrothele bispora (strain CBS 962.96) TaxID=1314807 RepID=A0A4V4HBD5_DENBC|nr:hypothetical protein K435DRAFT_876186 [Dendrothele bispora CBS 962.96]